MKQDAWVMVDEQFLKGIFAFMLASEVLTLLMRVFFSIYNFSYIFDLLIASHRNISWLLRRILTLL